MAGFDDDFGEMVAGGCGGELLQPGGGAEGGAADLLAAVEPDPAAAFLAREQEQLGSELEGELGGGAALLSTITPPLPPAPVPVREEPAVIKEWRQRQAERLRVKDEEEENARNTLKDQVVGFSKVNYQCR